jgi:CBS-domain-containing membrane protein
MKGNLMNRFMKIYEIEEYYREKSIRQKKKPNTTVVDDLIAVDVMSSGVVTISIKATINEAVALILDERVTALVVVDHNERPVGVFSETDLARFERERPHVMMGAQDQLRVDELNMGSGDNHFNVVTVDNPKIVDWMTPMIITVNVKDNLAIVCKTLTCNHIHRVFVNDDNRRLVGVISAMDIAATLALILNNPKHVTHSAFEAGCQLY